MTGQMCWLSALPSTEKILHLREDESKPWRPYKTSSFAVPDYLIPGGSRGYATMQVLMKQGWKLVGTQQAEEAMSQEMRESRNPAASPSRLTWKPSPPQTSNVS